MPKFCGRVYIMHGALLYPLIVFQWTAEQLGKRFCWLESDFETSEAKTLGDLFVWCYVFDVSWRGYEGTRV